jgi:ribosomal protein S12 methylthiotransferase
MNETSQARGRALPVLSAAPVRAATADACVAPADDAVRIGVVTLGCDKNTVDTERLLGRLVGAGARVHAGADRADVVVINTCGFIDVAKEESVDAILDAVQLKAAGRIRAVVAVGCLVQRYEEELSAEIPEVDLFLGLTELDQLVPALRARGLLPPAEHVSTMERPLRVLTARRAFSSYLKVSEGCDHSCAFCAIPLMRGRHRSTPIDVLVREAQALEASGIVELNLVSQDTTWYGRDRVRLLRRGRRDGGPAVAARDDFFVGRPFARMKGNVQAAAAASPNELQPGERVGLLPDLLEALLAETTLPWLRLFYMYPSGIAPELVELMAREERIVPYLDMPIQHGSDTMLERMRRPERRATILERVRWLRSAIPDLTLRTTVIVGFPGETETEFDELLDLLEDVRFDRVGAFGYSVEEDTLAAGMPDQVPLRVIRERLERLMDVQRGIAQERSERWIGRELDVLVERATGRGVHGGGRSALGRTKAQAPDIDGVVHLGSAPGVEPGTRIRARILAAFEEDLLAEPASAP